MRTGIREARDSGSYSLWRHTFLRHARVNRYPGPECPSSTNYDEVMGLSLFPFDLSTPFDKLRDRRLTNRAQGPISRHPDSGTGEG